jgi:hypothetical protein
MKAPTKPFALCNDNAGYQASLVPGKIYRILPDPRAPSEAKKQPFRTSLRASRFQSIV